MASFDEKWEQCNCEDGFDVGKCNVGNPQLGEMPRQSGAKELIRDFLSHIIDQLLECVPEEKELDENNQCATWDEARSQFLKRLEGLK